jgi:NAD(P)-dependent dehydrogenase (short-subunit alcohol dehydrogenase family)
LKIRFQEEHVHRFRDASLDFNPLHLSDAYARKTPFGEPVVYGVLGFLACLGQIRLPEGKVPSGVRIDFKSAPVVNLDYTIEANWESADRLKATLMDGSATAMRFHLQFREGTPALADLPETGTAPQTSARRLGARDFEGGPSFQGRYNPGRAAYVALLDLCGVDRGRWGDALPLAVLCSSYLTGMELPGECAAYSGLRAEILPGCPDLPLDFEIALESYEERFSLVRSRFSLSGASGVSACGEISAIARPPTAGSASTVPAAGRGRLAQRTAVVIGASRGLGAAMALDLAAEGCTVLGFYWRSGDEAAAVLEASRGLPGRLILEQGDASDPQWCCAMKSRIQAELGRLDLLICNAAPAIQPLRVEEACYGRIQTYLQKGFALVGAPLTSFLELVSASEGTVLLISSAAVENPPGSWPHYVALKGAVEGLLRAAAADHPKVRFWVARPHKIETDLINTPLGRLDAEKPETVARRILAQVTASGAAGTVHFCS